MNCAAWRVRLVTFFRDSAFSIGQFLYPCCVVMLRHGGYLNRFPVPVSYFCAVIPAAIMNYNKKTDAVINDCTNSIS